MNRFFTFDRKIPPELSMYNVENAFILVEEALRDMNYDKQEDPSGKDRKEAGAKLDKGKPLAADVLGGFTAALQGVVDVGTFGANKYSLNGWKAVGNAEQRYMNAAMRHILADLSGDMMDTESGLAHIHHAIWNLMAVCQFRREEADYFKESK